MLKKMAPTIKIAYYGKNMYACFTPVSHALRKATFESKVSIFHAFHF